MDGMGHPFLPHAAFPKDENGRIRLADRFDEVIDAVQ